MDTAPDDIAALKEALATERAKALDIAAELAVAHAKASEDSALIAQQKLRIAKLERQIYGNCTRIYAHAPRTQYVPRSSSPPARGDRFANGV
jgi:hypothetical protein